MTRQIWETPKFFLSFAQRLHSNPSEILALGLPHSSRLTSKPHRQLRQCAKAGLSPESSLTIPSTQSGPFCPLTQTAQWDEVKLQFFIVYSLFIQSDAACLHFLPKSYLLLRSGALLSLGVGDPYKEHKDPGLQYLHRRKTEKIHSQVWSSYFNLLNFKVLWELSWSKRWLVAFLWLLILFLSLHFWWQYYQRRRDIKRFIIHTITVLS